MLLLQAGLSVDANVDYEIAFSSLGEKENTDLNEVFLNEKENTYGWGTEHLFDIGIGKGLQ